MTRRVLGMLGVTLVLLLGDLGAGMESWALQDDQGDQSPTALRGLVLDETVRRLALERSVRAQRQRFAEAPRPRFFFILGRGGADPGMASSPRRAIARASSI